MALADAETLLREVSSRGLSIERRGQHLSVTPKRLLSDELREAIRSNRCALLQIVKGQRELPCPHDILERAAMLEFSEGIDRNTADAIALGEHGFASWEALALAHAE